MTTRRHPPTRWFPALVMGLGMVLAFAWLALWTVGGVT